MNNYHYQYNDSDNHPNVGIYCPICQEIIWASNSDDVRAGIVDGFIFVHKNVTHSEEDIEAIIAGIQ